MRTCQFPEPDRILLLVLWKTPVCIIVNACQTYWRQFHGQDAYQYKTEIAKPNLYLTKILSNQLRLMRSGSHVPGFIRSAYEEDAFLTPMELAKKEFDARRGR